MDRTIDLASAMALVFILKNGEHNPDQSYENFCQSFLSVRAGLEKEFADVSQTVRTQS